MDDLISRQAAIDATCANCAYDWCRYRDKGIQDQYCEYVGRLKDLPSVTPARKIGRWIDDCVCSNCRWAHEDVSGYPLITTFKYCPNCGAKMQEVEDNG